MKKNKILEQRRLDISDPVTAKQNIPDIEKYGDPDAWILLCKASSNAQGFMKSTKAMQIHNGCLVQTETQQKNPDGSWAISQAITFVQGVIIKPLYPNGPLWLGPL